MDVAVTCRSCGKQHVVRVSVDGFAKWKNGMNIQEALPKVSASDRELLISGICPTCWDKMFAEAD